ncbi:HAMP domain-containing sensor histidine kinase [Pedobacter sp. Leaf170]|uniref:tetratricopeptide repeat-containing sensor histidine kinase n=1 Tax=Pedobacter sp. Leaf170 TaxID=2876558 RepID=UPI001E56007F|nr:HAMP domain-containing sensor histidine kinase [Pedobacter sp. Leaf170]
MRKFFGFIGFSLSIWSMILSCNYTSNSNSDNAKTVDKLIDSANVLVERDSLSQAVFYLDSAFNKIPKPGIGDIWKTYYFKYRRYYWKGRDEKDNEILQKSMLYADSMQNLIIENNASDKYRNELSIAYFSKGDILLEQKKYREAYQFYHSGKLLTNDKGNTCSNGRINSRLANLNFLQENYHVAAAYFMQVYRNNLDCDLDEKKFGEIQGALNNAGASYLKVEMTDSAMYCFKNSLAFVERNEQQFPNLKNFVASAKGVIYQSIGEVYLDSGNYDQAAFNFEKSFYFNSLHKQGTRSAQSTAIKLARLNLALGNYTQYNNYLGQAKGLLKSTPDLENNAALTKLEINYFNQIRDYKSASTLQKLYSTLNNKIVEQKRNLSKFDVGREFYNLQKDYELSLLKKESQLRQLYLIIAAIFTILLFFIVYQLWRNWSKSKSINKQLSMLNNQITQQNLNLQETLMALEKSDGENKKVMKVIAHDLRSPIGAIVSLAGLMEDDDELAENDKYNIGLIKASATSSVKFINELLNKNNGKKEIEKELVELDALLKYCISLIKFKAEEKKQNITLRSSPVVIRINREQIWRVVSNLITNAIKFSKPNSVISLTLKQLNETILISVTDKGIGIPEDIREKIFGGTNDIKREGTSGEQSYGLGLFISKQIIEAHNGKIWFENNEGSGTTFFVELPLN